MINFILENGYNIKSLTIDNLSSIEMFYAKCSDYFILHEGVFPTKKEALELFNNLPAGKNHEDKYILGIYKDINELIGIIDIVKDFPIIGEWIIGLLLIKPEERNKGLGKQIHNLLIKWASTLGAKSFRVGVIEDNYKGKKFWTDLGYFKINEKTLEMEKKTNVVNVMIYRISREEKLKAKLQ